MQDDSALPLVCYPYCTPSINTLSSESCDPATCDCPHAHGAIFREEVHFSPEAHTNPCNF